MGEAAICLAGLCWSPSVLALLIGWVLAGMAATMIVGGIAAVIRDDDFPLARVLGVSWVYGPFAMLFVLGLRVRGQTKAWWKRR